MKNSHCSYCGQQWPVPVLKSYDDHKIWPRTCSKCENVTYINPIPVAVLLVPVNNGLLTVRRGIEPGKGLLALPGGYIDFYETWQEAAARELREETHIEINPSTIKYFNTFSSVQKGVIVIFGITKPYCKFELPEFKVTNETTERVIIEKPTDLAFPSHTEMAKRFFAYD